MFVDNDAEEKAHDDLLPFDVAIQYHILKMMTDSEHFLVLGCAYLKSSYFENSVLGWFFDTIVAHYNKYKTGIELVTLKNEILKFDSRDRSRYEMVFDEIQKSNYKDEDYLRLELSGWVKSRKFRLFYEDVRDLFNKNQRDNAYDLTGYAITQIQQINFNEDKIIHFDKIEDIIDKASRTTENRIPTGIPQIDDAMIGGLLKGTLTTILGSTNTGKTITLINFA